MFCPTHHDESLQRLILVGLVVSAAPMGAFLYSILVWFVYALFREHSWTHRASFRAMLLRYIVLVSAWVAASGIFSVCGTCGQKIPERSVRWCLLGLSLVVAIGYAVLGVKLMVSTRRDEVVGVRGREVPFYGPRALEGKFYAVTGANNGIGFETTRQLAEQGATVAMLCRNPVRAQKAMRDIRELQAHLHLEDPVRHPRAGISRDQLVFVPLDLTEFESVGQSVKALGQHLELRSQRTQKPSYVDALVCNAGLMMGTQSTTKDGLETMMQANHLGHFLLTKLMLDKGMLKTSIGGDDDEEEGDDHEPSRVCLLTSSAYHFAASTSGFYFEDPYCSNGLRKYTLFGQYSMTKLANLLTARELARRYNCSDSSSSSNESRSSSSGSSNHSEPQANSALAVFAVHPGIVRTNVTDNSWWLRWLDALFAPIVASFQKTAAEGAYSTVCAAAAPLSQVPYWKSGALVVNCREAAAHEYVEGPSGSRDAARLWEWSEEELAAFASPSVAGGSAAAASSGGGSTDAGEKKEQ